ncbi:hypothetical protein YS110_07525 [Acidovorax sp. YS12]|nr:hypothetical protein YS110_07525 [Acidovorax sp. YS12]
MTASIRRPWFGLSATLFGCLAVLAAVLPLWVLPVLLPPEPLDKVIVSTAEKVKARIAAKAKGVAYQEPARRTDWYSVLAAAAATFGALAIVLAAVSAVAREPRRFAAVAAALGVGALLFQLSVAVATALIVCVLVLAVLSALGITLPF